ncbi:uncharacterized protein isoform X2 [Rhodnius prolixus]|uniref:uncharacterized protein isoform X2 n=1 Tax=Rhodnius prolixus TaxID=13249 RepID=UPI003D189BA1
MKIPFSGTLGPYLRKYDKEIQILCSPCLFGSSVFVVTFSLLAMFITISDIFCLVHRDSLTPCFLRSLNPKRSSSITYALSCTAVCKYITIACPYIVSTN